MRDGSRLTVTSSSVTRPRTGAGIEDSVKARMIPVGHVRLSAAGGDI